MEATVMECYVDIEKNVEYTSPTEMKPCFNIELERIIQDMKSLQQALNSTRSFIELLKNQLNEAIGLEQELNEQFARNLDNEVSIRTRIENTIENPQSHLSNSLHLLDHQDTAINETVNMPVVQKRMKRSASKIYARCSQIQEYSSDTDLPFDDDIMSATPAHPRRISALTVPKLRRTVNEIVEQSACSDTVKALRNLSVGKPPKSVGLCEMCGSSFTRIENLRRHIKKNNCKKTANDTELSCCQESVQTDLKFVCDKRTTVRRIPVSKDYSTAKVWHGTFLEDARRNLEKLNSQVNVPAFLHQCPKCRFGFLYKKSLQNHLTRSSCQRVKKYKTKRQRNDTICQAQPKEHRAKPKIRTHNGQNFESQLPQGAETVAIDKSCFTCGKTDVAYWSKHSLRRDGRDCVCLDCEKLFLDFALLNSSEYENYREESSKRFVCVICKKSFEPLSGIWRHLRSHTGYQPHVCEKCGNTFITANALKLHILSQHQDRSLGVQCEFCCKMFPTHYRLKAHIQQMHSKKSFVCTVCKKAFALKNNLEVHMRYHTGDRRYPCNVCQKKFVRPVDLRQHMVSHSDKKPYQCRFCSKVFKWNNYLKKHMETHLRRDQ